MKKEEALAGGHVMNVTRRNSKQGPEFVNANDIIARPLHVLIAKKSLPKKSCTSEKVKTLKRKHVSPFLYYSHKSSEMTAEETPKIKGELVVAADIFGMELDMSKVLVPNEHCCGTREALWTLRLEKELVNDVLNVVAGMLTDQRPDHRRW
ncbi:hypothetical protein HN51_047869 [Arachis hypogaea]